MDRPEPDDPTIARLTAALRAPEANPGLGVRIEVSGGAPGERYRLEVEADHHGTATFGFADELRGVDRTAGSGVIPTRRWRRLLGLLADHPGLGGGRPTSLVPDGTVARWTVTAGDDRAELVRAADGGDELVAITYDAAGELIGPPFDRPG